MKKFNTEIKPVTNNRGIPFDTLMAPNIVKPEVVFDIDGNMYNTITIGTQTWMTSNLKTTKYRNGDAISGPTFTNTAWAALTTEAYCWHSDNYATYGTVYGALYNWYAVSDAKNIAPLGWHVATDAEWTTLTTYLGGESVAGGKLKEAGTSHWLSPNTEATNETGFTALPGGYRFSYDGTFINIGYYGNWWSSTEYGTSSAWGRHMYYNSSNASRNFSSKVNGFSVRCIKD